MRARPLAILALIGLGLWALYLLIASPEPSTDPGPTESPRTEGANGSADAGDTAKGASAPPTEIRDTEPEAGVRSDPKSGALLVRVVWADESPAVDVALVLRMSRPGYPYVALAREASDDKGVVRFRGLSPGKFSVRPHRGGYQSSVEATVVAGETVEARLEMPAGVDVHGIVVDEKGGAIADAGIWLTSGSKDWLGGRVVTLSDAEGRFRIRSAQKDASIGAIVAGFSPSSLFDLDEVDTATSPVSIRLTVKEPGGGIEGTVTSPSGDPVPGAVVCVGAQPRYFKQRIGGMYSHVETWTPLVATTDANGHYALRGVGPGEHPLHIRAAALAVFHATVTIEVGEDLRKDIQLLAGFTVHGTVRDGAGKTVAGAIVRAFDRAPDESFIQSGQIDYKSVFGYQYAVSDATGVYRLPHLTPGSVHLYAMPGKRAARGRSKIRAKTVVDASDGAESEWNPVLERGNTIVGIVAFRDGEPMKGHFVSAHNDKTGQRQSVVTDTKGRFEFVNMEPAHHSLGVQYWRAPKGTPPLEKKKVWPDGGEIRLIASFDSPAKKAFAKVRGRVQDTARRVSTGSLSAILQTDQNSWYTAEPKDGKFEFDQVQPGKVKVVLLSGETVIHAGPWFELAPAEERDVGIFTTEPGAAVDIRIDREKGTEAIEPRIYMRHPDSMHSVPVRPGRANSVRAGNICVGKYKVTVHGPGMMTFHGQVTAEVGVIATLRIRIRAAALCSLEVTLPRGEKLGALTFAVVDEHGKKPWSVTERNTGALPNPYKRKAYLAPGSYVLSVTSTTGLKGEHRFEVKDVKAEQPVVRLTVK